MRKQFFDGTGITSTSANHIANMAKEYIQTLESKIDNLSYVGEEVKISGDKFSTKLPTSKADVESLDARIQKIAKATQLIAWLREAIKEKQNAVNEILPMDAWIEREQEVYPDMPSKEKTITEAEIIAGWDVNKYNAYITAQTYATVYGEIVHPDGSISNARKKLTRAINAPTSVSGQGRDLMVTTQLPAFTQEEVDKQFFELQAKQREYQAKYNNYRYEIECIIQADEDRKQQEFTQKFNEICDTRKAVQARYSKYVIDRQNYYRGLKIAIPEQLVDIYKEIQELGK